MNLQTLSERFDELDAKLRNHGLSYGPDVWQNVYRLLHKLQRQGRLPQEPQQLAPLLGPLFCRYPEDQARFPSIFQEWLNNDNRVGAENQFDSQPRQALQQAKLKFALNRKWWWLATLLLTISLLGVSYWIAAHREPSKPSLPIINESAPKKGKDSTDAKQPKETNIKIQDVVSPRPQAEPTEDPWPILTQAVTWTIYGLPLIAAMLWMARQYRRRMVLRTEAADSTDTINQLQFERKLQPIFGGTDAERNLRDLRSAQYQTTRRLDVETTVERTARGGDYFQPVYWHKRHTPSHVMLVRVQHPRDQQAAMAQELASRFRELGLPVEIYHFRDDPRHSVRISNDKPATLSQLLTRHAQDRLLIISDVEILYHPLTGAVRPWLEQLKPGTPQIPPRIWLHTRDADQYDLKQLTAIGFMAMPLRRDHFSELVDCLTGVSTKPIAQSAPWPLPDSLRMEPEAWLREKPPLNQNLEKLVWELGQYLGSYGLTLLRAIAVYPKPHWHLTLALDLLLHGNLEDADPAQRRESRLSRISRLPWLTLGYLPRWLREYLLIHIDTAERQRICAAWQTLFSQLTDLNRPYQLQLDIHTPSKRQLKLRLNELRTVSSSELDDAIFSNILLGGKLGYLDFQIPLTFSKIFPHSRYWLHIKPAMLALLLAIIGFSTIGYVWQQYGHAKWQQGLLVWQQYDNAHWRVEITPAADTETTAQALQQALQLKQFDTWREIMADKAENSGSNTINYPPQATAQAQQIAKSLSWLTYGADVKLLPDPQLQGKNIQVKLAAGYRHGSGFNDALTENTGQTQAGLFETLKNRLQAISRIQQAISNLIAWFDRSRLEPYEPETVEIPPGSFMMGSPASEAGRYPDEGPQHKVTIAYPFAIGKTEVTFAQYDAFADATGHKKPDDNGWGRGDRPVINVSFDDAQAYAQWLSKQTGKSYRLPTEAEWEYAARAGTQTRYWWGDDIGKNNANCADCGSQWDNNQTAPVASFKANSFGLSDTAGNVWEWTQDCRHNDYQGTPQDGSAWLEANQGDCGRRVVRGGSWNYGPVLLRSAFRFRFIANEANYILGFRIARAL